MNRITGWLCPGGEFVECDTYHHMSVVSKNPVFCAKAPKVTEILERLESIEEDCQDMADREGSHNAEWHVYEMACDRAKDQIYEALLDVGFIRVGESADHELHFEGKPYSLKKYHQVCVDLADSYGTSAVFEPIKNK